MSEAELQSPPKSPIAVGEAPARVSSTNSVACAHTSLRHASISARPGATAFATPNELTVATFGSLLVQVADEAAVLEEVAMMVSPVAKTSAIANGTASPGDAIATSLST